MEMFHDHFFHLFVADVSKDKDEEINAYETLKRPVCNMHEAAEVANARQYFGKLINW